MRNTSLFLALAFGITMAGCGDDETTDTGASSTTAGSTTAGTSTSAGTTSAGTTSAGTTTDGTTTMGGSTGGGGAGFCNLSCADAMECVPPMGDPMQWACTDMFCEFTGTCMDICVAPGFECFDGGGFDVCSVGCAADMDCEDNFLMGWTCTGDDGGNMFCEPPDAPGCMADADCAGNGVCNTDNGACECGSDADCTNMGFACDLP